VTEQPTRDEPTYARVDAALERLPSWLERPVGWGLSRWPGRIFLATTAGFIKLEIFDRSMSIAAQFFTSVFPIVIMLATWFGDDGSKLAKSLGLPSSTENLIDQAMAGQSQTAFGVVGVIIVLASATSLSRALTRAYASIWDLPRPRIQMVNAWRWVTVVMTLVLALLAARLFVRVTDGLPPPGFWQLVSSILFDVGLTVFIGWILLAGAVPVRRLVPGALLFGVCMLFIRPASAVFLPRSLDQSAEHYGSFGVAFTYLAWLYIISYCLLASNAIGAVVTNDNGPLGTWIRGESDEPEPSGEFFETETPDTRP
jgi:membrane protein